MKKVTKEVSIKIILHLLVWAILLALPLYSLRRMHIDLDFTLIYYAFMAVNGILFYTNYLVLVPRFFFRKKRVQYMLSVLVLVLCFYYLSDIFNNVVINYLDSQNPAGIKRNIPFPPRGMWLKVPFVGPHVVGYVSSSFFIIFLSLGIKVMERQFRIEKMQEELEKTKLTNELAILKNQISPHFFFNTLNNIYSLIGRNNEDSKNAVIRLSKLMRYVLNESGRDKRLLSEEVEFMNNYIDLMKLRIGTKTRLSVDFPAENTDIMVPHLLFISLIENAFKYGISVQEESLIAISLHFNGNNIHFHCENGLPEMNNEPLAVSSGIGLENLRKRLNLLYPGSHKLEINKSNTKFEVNLTIRV